MEIFPPIEEWLGHYHRPLIIAGPCSAESEQQVIATAKFLAGIPQVKIFRSGIWKPRTKPGEFEGVGFPALRWLQKVREKTRLLTCVEVAQPEHVEACLNHNVDILWIGSRTVVNPFSIKEISVALRGMGIPVMVKNPMHPDIELWTGALERLQMSGIGNLAAIHRGFSTYLRKPFRNTPHWEIPIELKRRFPSLPIIIDPSHISGDRRLVPGISQLALDMAFDGLMVEVHPTPEQALSDQEQQLDFEDFEKMIAELQTRVPTDPEREAGDLKLLRERIDHLDEALIDILSQRLETVKEIGAIKRRMNLPLLQLERWQEVLQQRLEAAGDRGLDREFMKKMMEQIHQEAIRIQGNKPEK